MNLTKLDYDLLKLKEGASIDEVASSIILQANNGSTSMGIILDKVENELPIEQRHRAYGAVAKAYYQAIEDDVTYIALTKEICLRDLMLMVDNLIDEEDCQSLDILAILAANYEIKDTAIKTLETIIDSGYAYTKYLKLREMIINDRVRKD